MNWDLKFFGIIFIMLTLSCTVAGQLLIKKGMFLITVSSQNEFRLLQVLYSGLTNPWVIAGLMLAVIAACSWIITLSRLALSYAYPFLSITFPLVVILSSKIFHEPVSSKTFIGLGLIIVGLIIASS